jgi:hypothetical protein
MYKNILSYLVSLTIIMVFVTPLFLLAQSSGTTGNTTSSGTTGNPTGPIVIVNPFKANTIQDLIKSIVNDILMPIGGVVAVLMIMYAGFLFVTAGGEPGKITKAKDALLWGVIGAAILLGAWVISQAISTTIDRLKT